METFCPMLSILETLWPETFWAVTKKKQVVTETHNRYDNEQVFPKSPVQKLTIVIIASAFIQNVYKDEFYS